MEKIVLVGAGGHAKTIVETIEKAKSFEIAGFVGPGEIGEIVYRGYKRIGNDEDLEELYNHGIHNAVLAIGFMGNSNLRNKLFHTLKKYGYEFPVIIDDTASIALDVTIGEGTYIGRHAVINANAHIGKACILNTASIVEHDCIIGDFSHVSVAAVVCGQSEIGQNVLVGSNATIIQGLKIMNHSIIGAGAVVTKDVLENSLVIGVPAKKI